MKERAFRAHYGWWTAHQLLNKFAISTDCLKVGLFDEGEVDDMDDDERKHNTL